MPRRTQNRADIGILTVIPSELEWTRLALKVSLHSRRKVRGGRIYYFGEAPALFASRPYRIALSCIGEAGTADCAAAATALIHEYHPKIVVLVGIAAGIRGQVRIGSVILSERVWGYEKEAVLTGKKGRKISVPRPDAPTIPFTVQQDVTHYLSVDGMMEHVAGRFTDLGGEYLKNRRNKRYIADSPDVRSATIASGNKLLRNPRVLYRLQSAAHGRIKVGEMEASGLTTACHQESVHWLVVRGVSDFGDKLKSDQFHKFAAQMAAAVLADFVERGLQLSVRATSPKRRPKRIPDVPTLSEIQAATSRLSTARPRKQEAGPVAARMLELSTPFKRSVYRVLRSRFSPEQPLPRTISTRWSPRVGVLYFALSERDALAEILAAPNISRLEIDISRLDLVCAEFTAQLSYVLDLTNYAVLKALDISLEALSQGDYTYSQSVAEAARIAGCEALLVPSSRPGQLPHLVVFDRITTASVLKVGRTWACRLS